MEVIEIGEKIDVRDGVVGDDGVARTLILIEATREEVRRMPNLLYREVEIKEVKHAE